MSNLPNMPCAILPAPKSSELNGFVVAHGHALLFG